MYTPDIRFVSFTDHENVSQSGCEGMTVGILEFSKKNIVLMRIHWHPFFNLVIFKTFFSQVFLEIKNHLGLDFPLHRNFHHEWFENKSLIFKNFVKSISRKILTTAIFF